MDAITIIGAGVSGLTCGVVLAREGREVTIVAGDVDSTNSHAAAAIWYPYHVASPELEVWAGETRRVLESLCDDPDAGVSLINFEVRGEGVMQVPLMDTSRYLPYLRRRFEAGFRARRTAAPPVVRRAWSGSDRRELRRLRSAGPRR